MDEREALSGRRALSDDEARDRLRAGLLQRFRDDARYKNIVRQDLTPVWKAALASGWWRGNRPLTFHDVLDRLHELPTTSDQSPLPPQRYVRVVAKMVGHTMGLTSDGVPCGWALRSVHDDVIGQPRRGHVLSISPRVTDDDIALSLDLTPNFLSSRFVLGQGAAETQQRDVDFTYYGVGYGSEHWAALGRTATLVVTETIIQMREIIDRRYPARNSATVDGWERDLDTLFCVLFRGERPDGRAMEVRLRRLCERLQIDSPLSRRPLPMSPAAAYHRAEEHGASAAS